MYIYIYKYIYRVYSCMYVVCLCMHMLPSIYIHIIVEIKNAPGTHPDSGRPASAGVRGCSMVFGPKHQAWGKKRTFAILHLKHLKA